MTKTSKNAWLEYDWKLDGGDARFRVDMSLYTNAPIEGCTELVFIYCASLSEQPLKAGELRRIDSLIARCIKKLGKEYVGCIESAAMHQYYFYIDSEEKYSALQQLLQKEENQKFEKYTLRKLKFRGDVSNEAVPHYYLCVKNQDEDAIYLEKKYMQMHIWHRACAKLSRTDCDRILRGDIEWMKDSKEALFQDFYLQATLNHLSPGNVIEYQKERLKCKEGYVAFVKKVRCVVGGWGNLFWPEAMTIQCLEENKVLTVYKKRVNLPNTIWEMMQGTAILSEDMAFAF